MSPGPAPAAPAPAGEQRGGDEGQAATEVALVLPLVALLLLAAVQVTLVLKDHILVVHAAREGARQAAVDRRGEAVLAAVLRSAPLKESRVQAETAGGGGSPDVVVVQITYRSPTDVPLVGRLLPDVIIRAKAAMRVEVGHAP